MTKSQELIFIRHGQSTANAAGIWQGQLDYPLSDLGREQAAQAGRALAQERLDAFYAGPLSRAYETAAIIADHTSYEGEVFRVSGLAERAGGTLEGTTAEQRLEDNPALIEKFLSLPEEERWSLVGAETDDDVLQRVSTSVSEIRSQHPPDARIVLVSHGGAMRAYFRELFGGEILTGKARTPNASITRIHWPEDSDAPSLASLAETEHLD
jgi:broad specificity phosphatase PhoE